MLVVRALTVAVVVTALASPPGGAESSPATPAERAVALYDEGRYAEAREIFERLDAEGKADGATLYRLAFCLRRAGERHTEREVLHRAIARLGEEVPSATTLEPAFYLANAYRNVDRLDEARRVAAAAVERVESGELAAGDDPVEWFRLGKLYADQGRQEPAVRWYRKAADGFAENEGAYPAYRRWALRYIAEVHLSSADFERAERALSALAEGGEARQADLDRLAVARVRLGRWSEAGEAWRRAEKLDPARANRARYCWRLCRLAESLGSLPEADAEGNEYRSMSRADLEDHLVRQAQRVGELRGEAGAEGTSEEELAALQDRLDVTKGHFTAAALEFAARNHPIRETAFSSGYAPLIFKEKLWRVTGGRSGRPAPGS